VLRDLTVRNLAVVAEASLELGPGLNILTGETGAGKSIVVDALALLSGARASSDLIRTGCDRLVVAGRFEPESNGWRDRLRQVGIDPVDDELVVRREVSREGRNRVFVNDVPVTLRLLAEIAPELVRIHTQREELGLLESGLQRSWLDRGGGVEGRSLVEEVEQRFEEYQERLARLEEVSGDDRLRTERIDLLRFQASEIAEAALNADEDEVLRAERDTLRHADTIRAALDGAYTELSDGDGAVAEVIARTERDLESVRGWLPNAGAWLEELASARVRIEEVSRAVASELAGVESNPNRLDAVESRLAVIERLSRKYGGSAQEILAALEVMREELDRLVIDSDERADLETMVSGALARYGDSADRLSEARLEWGERIADLLREELSDLALKSTRFAVRLGRTRRRGSPLTRESEEIDFGAHGIDRVEFLFASNPGEALAPLAKAASGGELARLYLALQLAVGADLAPRPTLVFDEVDAGVGGAEAAAVGRKLKRIADTGQTLVVTHLPQVASFANRHFRVAKGLVDGRTETRVEALDEPARVREIARMLGGEDITDLSISHAEELITLSEAG